MPKKKTYVMVGLFVVIGILSLLAVIFNYAGHKFTTNNKDLVVMYFEESIRGLTVGSPVVFQGVEIGKVEKIRLVTNFEDISFKTQVYVLFDGKKTYDVKHNRYEEDDKTLLDNMIKKGLRARLASANYLTGQLMIELVMDPDTPAVMRGTGKYAEIPTELSPFTVISNDLKEIPLRESLIRLGDLVVDLNENLPAILSNITQITAKMDRMLDKKSGEASKTMNNFNSTMEEIAKASRSLKNLMDYLERHPEALLHGKEK